MMNLKTLLFTGAIVAMLVGCSNQIPAMNPAGHTHDGTDTTQNGSGVTTGGGTVTATSGGTTKFSNAVTFEIPAGTAAKDWNAVATPIQVAVGGTVTFVNKDSIAHQIHTNSKNTLDAFPHGNPIAPGASVTYTVTGTFDNTKAITNGSAMYSHIDGTGTHIYFQSK